MNEPLPRFLDCEASSLSDNSYPVEIAWSAPDGSVESHLVRPAPDWDEWSEQSEEVHGISRERLLAEGLPSWIVARRMNESLAGAILHSDAPAFDTFWIDRLFEQHGEDRTFEIRHADLAFGVTANRLAELTPRAWELAGGSPHRAADDVRHLIELYRLCRQDG